MIAQGMSEVDVAAKLVDNTTISKDVKALKLISKQFIYDITKSDFTYYYKQCLELVKLGGPCFMPASCMSLQLIIKVLP